MSISSFQEKFLNKGCGTAIIVVSSLALAIGMFSSQCARGNMINNSVSSEEAVVTVGNVPVSAQMIQAAADSQGGADESVLDRATDLGQATSRVVNNAAAAALVLEGGEPSEDEVATAAGDALQSQFDRQKQMMIMMQKLKPDATDADLEKAMAPQLNGQTLEGIKKAQVSQIVAAYKDPAKKENVIQALARALLTNRVAKKSTLSDEALRDTYKTLVFKRVFLSDASGAKETTQARAQKVLDGLKTGHSFADMMDLYSNDSAPMGNGKKVHDAEDAVPANQVSARPELASIKDKPVGTVSGVVDVPGGKAIYELAAIRSNAPADLEKNKDRYRRQIATSTASNEIDQKIKAFVSSDKVTWNSKGFEALFLLQGMTQGMGDQKSAQQKAFDLSQQAIKSDQPGEARIGALAALVAESALYNAPDADKAKLVDQRIGVLETVFSNGLDDGQLRLELVDLYAQKKNGAKATEALVAASKGNVHYDAAGQKLFSDIAGKAMTLQQQGVITADQLKTVQAQQVAWSDARASFEKATADAKKQEEATKKANEEEIARQKAEAAKANAGKPGAPSVGLAPPGGLTPPTGGPAGASAAPATTGGDSKLFGGTTGKK